MNTAFRHMSILAGLLASAGGLSAQGPSTARDLPSVYVNDGGSGPGVPVVFIHGNGGSSEQWTAQLTAIRANRRAIAYDLRGMGRSPVATNADYSLDASVRDLEQVLQDAGIARVVLVGHSYGAAVAARFAAEHGDAVAGLVLVEAAGSLDIPDAAAKQLETALRSSRDQLAPQLFGPALAPSSAEVKASVLASIAKSDPSAFAATLLGLRSLDMRAAVGAYHGPRLAVAASSVEQPAAFQRRFPEYPLKRVDGAGHWLMLDRPAEFNAILVEFLARVDLTPGARQG